MKQLAATGPTAEFTNGLIISHSPTPLIAGKTETIILTLQNSSRSKVNLQSIELSHIQAPGNNDSKNQDVDVNYLTALAPKNISAQYSKTTDSVSTTVDLVINHYETSKILKITIPQDNENISQFRDGKIEICFDVAINAIPNVGPTMQVNVFDPESKEIFANTVSFLVANRPFRFKELQVENNSTDFFPGEQITFTCDYELPYGDKKTYTFDLLQDDNTTLPNESASYDGENDEVRTYSYTTDALYPASIDNGYATEVTFQLRSEAQQDSTTEAVISNIITLRCKSPLATFTIPYPDLDVIPAGGLEVAWGYAEGYDVKNQDSKLSLQLLNLDGDIEQELDLSKCDSPYRPSQDKLLVPRQRNTYLSLVFYAPSGEKYKYKDETQLKKEYTLLPYIFKQNQVVKIDRWLPNLKKAGNSAFSFNANNTLQAITLDKKRCSSSAKFIDCYIIYFRENRSSNSFNFAQLDLQNGNTDKKLVKFTKDYTSSDIKDLSINIKFSPDDTTSSFSLCAASISLPTNNGIYAHISTIAHKTESGDESTLCQLHAVIIPSKPKRVSEHTLTLKQVTTKNAIEPVKGTASRLPRTYFQSTASTKKTTQMHGGKIVEMDDTQKLLTMLDDKSSKLEDVLTTHKLSKSVIHAHTRHGKDDLFTEKFNSIIRDKKSKDESLIQDEVEFEVTGDTTNTKSNGIFVEIQPNTDISRKFSVTDGRSVEQFNKILKSKNTKFKLNNPTALLCEHDYYIGFSNPHVDIEGMILIDTIDGNFAPKHDSEKHIILLNGKPITMTLSDDEVHLFVTHSHGFDVILLAERTVVQIGRVESLDPKKYESGFSVKDQVYQFSKQKQTLTLFNRVDNQPLKKHPEKTSDHSIKLN